MNWDAIGATGEVIGAIAVIGTIFYLAIQVRQNSAIVRANSEWDTQLSFASINELIAQGGTIGEVTFKGFSDPDSLTPYEAYLFHRIIRATLQKLEAQYALYRRGNLDDEIWGNRRSFAKSLTISKAGALVWELEKRNSMYTESFVQEIERTEPPELGGWLGINEVMEKEIM